MTPQQTPQQRAEELYPFFEYADEMFNLIVSAQRRAYIDGYNSRDEEVAEWEEKFKEMQEYAMEKRQLLFNSVELAAKNSVEILILREVLVQCKVYFGENDKTVREHVMYDIVKNALK